MNFIKKNLEKLLIITSFSLTPLIIFAQTTGLGSSTTGLGNSTSNTSSSSTPVLLSNPLGNTNTVPDFIKIILTNAIKIGIPIVALAIIYCGFLFVFARGNSEKLTHAREALLWTIIGAAILLGALAIATMIQGTITALGS